MIRFVNFLCEDEEHLVHKDEGGVMEIMMATTDAAKEAPATDAPRPAPPTAERRPAHQAA